MNRLTGKIGQYKVPTYEDFESACEWHDLDEFTKLLIKLCNTYAEKLDEYERLFEDDGK